jgi:hypothetical protein
MISERERQWRLASFVDRDNEMARFCALLESQGKMVMSVTGPGGIGKTSLLARMIHEIACREVITKVEVIFADGDPPEFMTVLRTCRDNIDPKAFNTFTDLVNYYTDPHYKVEVSLQGGTINVGNNVTVTDGGSIGMIAGMVIKDAMFTSTRSDLGVTLAEQRARLTNLFVSCLAEAAKTREQIVILIDGAEKMNEPTARWLWDAFIGGVDDKKIPNIRFVIFGRAKPSLEPWQEQFVELAELQALEIPDIVLYLEKRGVKAEVREAVADMVYVATGGNPFDVANRVSAFLKLQERHAAGAK